MNNPAAPEIKIPPSAEVEPEDMPLPTDAKTVFLGLLVVMAGLACAYFAREVILPIVLAFVLKLLLQPVMRVLGRLHIPRPIASLALILALWGILAGLGGLLSGPAHAWAARLPEGLPRLQERVKIISAPLQSLQEMTAHAKGVLGQSAGGGAGESAGKDIQGAILTGAQTFASEFLTTFLVLFFLLNSGDTFLRRLVEVMPRFRDKRQVIEIASQVEGDVSSYLVTISLMNLAVGVATGLGMWALGLDDPVLWGAVAFILNYVPILGPLVGIVTFLGVGMLSLEPLWKAFMPMVVYAGIHLLEGETITPMLLARRFTLNPVIVIISLLFWDWMWGVPGAVLAVPMLAITKILCDGIRPLAAFGHFLEGEKSDAEKTT